jgi:putative ABC transport system ATP-binding protein
VGRAERVARVFQDPMAGTCEDLTIEENMALARQRGTRRGLRGAVKQAERACTASAWPRWAWAWKTA